MAVVRIETGMAVSEIAVVRQLSRKANSTTATTSAASSSTRLHVADRGLDEVGLPEHDLVGLDAVRQAGAELGQRLPRSRCVSATVSTLGCFSTETMTAGLPM